MWEESDISPSSSHYKSNVWGGGTFPKGGKYLFTILVNELTQRSAYGNVRAKLNEKITTLSLKVRIYT